MSVYTVTPSAQELSGVYSNAYNIRNAGGVDVYLGTDSSLSPDTRSVTLTPGSTATWGGKTPLWAVCDTDSQGQLELIYTDDLQLTSAGSVNVVGGTVEATINGDVTATLDGPVALEPGTSVQANVSGPVTVGNVVTTVGDYGTVTNYVNNGNIPSYFTINNLQTEWIIVTINSGTSNYDAIVKVNVGYTDTSNNFVELQAWYVPVGRYVGKITKVFRVPKANILTQNRPIAGGAEWADDGTANCQVSVWGTTGQIELSSIGMSINTYLNASGATHVATNGVWPTTNMTDYVRGGNFYYTSGSGSYITYRLALKPGTYSLLITTSIGSDTGAAAAYYRIDNYNGSVWSPIMYGSTTMSANLTDTVWFTVVDGGITVINFNAINTALNSPSKCILWAVMPGEIQ